MPIVIAPNGQPVFALTADLVDDYLRQGYRLPKPDAPPVAEGSKITQNSKPKSESADASLPQPEPPKTNGSLNLLEATLAELVALPDVGTARAKKVRKLAQDGRLNLDSLQAEVPDVDWVAMYNEGLVIWPGGLHVVEAE